MIAENGLTQSSLGKAWSTPDPTLHSAHLGPVVTKGTVIMVWAQGQEKNVPHYESLTSLDILTQLYFFVLSPSHVTHLAQPYLWESQPEQARKPQRWPVFHLHPRHPARNLTLLSINFSGPRNGPWEMCLTTHAEMNQTLDPTIQSAYAFLAQSHPGNRDLSPVTLITEGQSGKQEWAVQFPFSILRSRT